MGVSWLVFSAWVCSCQLHHTQPIHVNPSAINQQSASNKQYSGIIIPNEKHQRLIIHWHFCHVYKLPKPSATSHIFRLDEYKKLFCVHIFIHVHKVAFCLVCFLAAFVWRFSSVKNTSHPYKTPLVVFRATQEGSARSWKHYTSHRKRPFSATVFPLVL